MALLRLLDAEGVEEAPPKAECPPTPKKKAAPKVKSTVDTSIDLDALPNPFVD